MTAEVAFSENDEYIVCGDCNRSCIFGECPDHGRLEWITDSLVGSQSRDGLPSNLCFMPSSVGQGQMGVFAMERIDKRVMFGPFVGRMVPVKETNLGENSNFMHMWDFLEGGKVSYIIDGTDEDRSNWMRFVNCARSDKEQNLLQLQYRGAIYFKTIAPVEAGSELLVWYQDSCVRILESSSHQTGDDFVCDVCRLVFPGPTFFLRHKSVRCPGIKKAANHLQRSESQVKGTSIDRDSATPCVGQTESSYVIVHIEANSNENHVTRNDTVEDSPYVVVHVQPAPTCRSDSSSSVRRRKRIPVDEKAVKTPKKPKLADTRQRSAVNSEGTAKKVASQERSTADAVKKSKKAACKTRLTKARIKSSLKAQTAKTAAAKKSLTIKRTLNGKKTPTASGSTSSRSRGGTAKNVSRSRTGQRKSAAVRKSTLSRSRMVPSGKKNDGKAAKDKAVNNATGKKAVVKVTKTKRRKTQKRSDELKLSPSREESSVDIAAVRNEDKSVEKQTPKKTPPKANSPKDSENKEDCTPAKKRKVTEVHVLKEKTVITCDICSKNFKWQSQLNYHMRRHASEKEFKCTFCNKGLSQMSSLKRHLRIHSGEKPYGCEECGKRFLEKTRLMYHQRKHSGDEPEKKYKCTFCDRRFTLSANMKTHMRTHTGEKPYPCPQCGKTFRRSSDITSHLRSHTGERPYKCSHCPKAFTMISHRKRHEIIHTGEKPFKCDICGKGFTQPNSVKAHLKVHARKQALVESQNGGSVQRPRESALSNATAVRTADKAVATESSNGIAQNSGSDKVRVDEVPGPGSTAETCVESTSTETLHSSRTELQVVATEHSHQGNIVSNELTQPGIQNQVAANLLSLSTTQVGQTVYFNLSNTEVPETATPEIGPELTTVAAEQLQLSCSDEQFTIISSRMNAEGLIPLTCVTQSGSDAENVELRLEQHDGQYQVDVTEGEETAPTLLAL